MRDEARDDGQRISWLASFHPSSLIPHPLAAPTSPNLVTAFLRGVQRETSDQALAVMAYRCTRCGRLELYAADENWCTKGRE